MKIKVGAAVPMKSLIKRVRNGKHYEYLYWRITVGTKVKTFPFTDEGREQCLEWRDAYAKVVNEGKVKREA